MSSHHHIRAAVLSVLAPRHTTADPDMDGLHRADTAEDTHKHVRTLAHAWSSLASSRPSPLHADEIARALGAAEQALAASVAETRDAKALRATALRALRALDGDGGAT